MFYKKLLIIYNLMYRSFFYKVYNFIIMPCAAADRAFAARENTASKGKSKCLS